MSKQNGGLKLIHPEKHGFKAVYDMINRGRLQLLTYESLKGFMFTLNVAEADSEYFTFSGTRFTKPVTSFILKLAVITPNNNENLDTFKGRGKSSESDESYFEEAKLQQQIWKTSIGGNRPEICPSVANFSLFDNSDSNDLLTFLDRYTTTLLEQEVFTYLRTQINKPKNGILSDNGIGVIVMPNVERSTTFSGFLGMSNFNGVSVNTESKNTAYAYVIAQIVRLYLNIGVIHFDLHLKNILIYLSSSNQIKSVLIDFGRASNLMTGEDDDYLDIAEKRMSILGIKEPKFNELFDLNINTPDKKSNFIIKILNYIARTDYEKNQAMFGNSSTYPPDRYQMDWWENVKTNKIICERAFDKLKEMMISPDGRTGLTQKSLTNYEKEGHLVDFTKEILDFIVPFPGPTRLVAPVAVPRVQLVATGPVAPRVAVPPVATGPVAPACDKPGCTIMGGRKNKKSKKHKTKKQRKSKKYIYI